MFRDSRTAAIVAGAACAITLLHAALSAKAVGHFSPDSWSAFELSKSAFHDFYRVTTIRQFSYEAPAYGASFPPLPPLLAALWNAIAHAGVYAATWINLIAAAAMLPLLLSLSRRLAASSAPGIITAAALVGNPWYLDEVMGGRAIPIALLLFTVLLLLLHRMLTADAHPVRTAIMAGVAAGLVFETRFDFLLPAIAIGIVLPGKARGRLSVTGAYFVGLAAAMSPWVIYSLARFGVPLVSDNLRTIISVGPLPVTRFVPFPETIATFRNAPFEWLASKISGSWPAIEALSIALGASAVPALAAMWAATRGGSQGLPRAATMVLVLTWLALGLEFVATALVGSPDVRYGIAIVTFGTFTLAALLCNGSEIPHLAPAAVMFFVPAQVALLAAAAHHPDRLAGIFSFLWPAVIVAFVVSESPLRASRALTALGTIGAVLLPLGALGVGSVLAARATGTPYRLSADATERTRPAHARILDALDGADPARAHLLLTETAGVPEPSEFGARTGVFTVRRPTPPFGWLDLWLLVHRYGITHVSVGDPDLDTRLPVLFAIHKSANGVLWAIDGERHGLVVVDENHPAGSTLELNTMQLITNLGPADASRARQRTPDEWSYPLLFVPAGR